MTEEQLAIFIKVAEDMMSCLLKMNDMTMTRALAEISEVDTITDEEFEKLVADKKEFVVVEKETLKFTLAAFALNRRILARSAGLMKSEVEESAQVQTQNRFVSVLKDLFWAIAVAQCKNIKIQTQPGVCIRKTSDDRVILFGYEDDDDPRKSIIKKLLGGLE